ncbi:hypothetical protein QR685DRAFT_543365 [Neurospora intermedia]|uniref:Uncharacterized protein n=1 Tax=Neurospora intermedia TaxID=5142 RepID=A0ABR3DHT7_NEUIN
MSRPFDAHSRLGGLRVGLERHRIVLDSVWGENNFGGLWTSVVMVEIAEGGQSKGKYQIDCNDGHMDIGDKLDDDLKDIKQTRCQARGTQLAAAHAYFGWRICADAHLVDVDPVGGNFGSEPTGYHVDARDGVKEDRVGKRLVALGVLVYGEGISLYERERSEVDLQICIWEC